MRIVVSGASGLIGRPLLARLRQDGHDVLQLVRRPSRGPQEVTWDPTTGRLDPAALQGVEAAVNLSGAGVGDKRWTPEYQEVIRRSRIDSTLTLAGALAELTPRPRVLLQGSAIGLYGDRGDEVLTERSVPGQGFLAEVVTDWEAAARPAVDAGIRVAHLRTGLVMSPDGGAFGRLLPLFKVGLGGRLGAGSMWWSWITMPDWVAAAAFLLEQEVSGPVNLTGPEPVTNKDMTAAMGRALRRPALFFVPPVGLRAGLGGFASEIMASQRVVPRTLQDAGFRFTHSDADAAARWLAAA